MDLKTIVPFYLVLLCTIIAISPAISHGGSNHGGSNHGGSNDDDNVSRATYYGDRGSLGTSSGACGFGEYGKTINDGQVTGVSNLYRGGAGCGDCYLVKCTIRGVCSEDGTMVVVTDYGQGDETDFILSATAFAKLALPNMAEQLFPFGVVDVVFQRVPCEHNNNNLEFKVKEPSKSPGYLAIVPLYQPGTYEISTIQLWQEDRNRWRSMRRAYGAVFDITNLQMGSDITLRMGATAYGYGNSNNNYWIKLNNVIPNDWKAGNSYDTGISS